MHVVGQNDFADLSQRSPHRGHLEQHVDAVAILGDHALKAGYLSRNPLQSRLHIAAGSFIHAWEIVACCVPLYPSRSQAILAADV